MEKSTRYGQIQEDLKKKIQQGSYEVGDLLPSENELCAAYHVTRTTARKALQELQNEGYITRQHGKGSIVSERRNTLGLLTVRGFSETVGHEVRNVMISKPSIHDWSRDFSFSPSEKEVVSKCIHFSRLRCVGTTPVMLEESWLAADCVPTFMEQDFVDGSFFKTLSKRYMIEITGSEQELRAIRADENVSILLHVAAKSPVLYIAVRYTTSLPGYYVYSKLYCNTDKYPIGNVYTSPK